jgi:hypothetical protein
MSSEHLGYSRHFVEISGKTSAVIKYKHAFFPRNGSVRFCPAVNFGYKQLMPFSSADISPAKKGIEFGSSLKIR